MERQLVMFIKWLAAFGVICALIYLCLALPAGAAPIDKNGAPESQPKDAGKDAGGKPDANSKEDDAATDEGKPEIAPAAADQVQSGVKMKDLLAEGFLIRTTVLVPADAVTRQLGKISSDAIILTLQKETAIAVCYYTLKAYVKEGLTNIASCTAFR
jgi:hypothetical protein